MSFQINNLSEEQLKQYIDCYNASDPNYQRQKSYEKTKQLYLKNIDVIMGINDKLQIELQGLKHMLEEKEKDFNSIYERCDKISVMAAKNVQRIRKLPVEFGSKEGYAHVRKELAETANIKFEYFDYHVLHIILPDLIPLRPRLNQGNYALKNNVDFDYIRSSYSDAFLQEFRKGKFRTYSQKVVIFYVNYYKRNEMIRDHDNLDSKIITDIITQHLLIDDDPTCVSTFMDFSYGKFDHTEAYVIPEEYFPNFFIWFKKNIQKKLL